LCFILLFQIEIPLAGVKEMFMEVKNTCNSGEYYRDNRRLKSFINQGVYGSTPEYEVRDIILTPNITASLSILGYPQPKARPKLEKRARLVLCIYFRTRFPIFKISLFRAEEMFIKVENV